YRDAERTAAAASGIASTRRRPAHRGHHRRGEEQPCRFGEPRRAGRRSRGPVRACSRPRPCSRCSCSAPPPARPVPGRTATSRARTPAGRGRRPAAPAAARARPGVLTAATLLALLLLLAAPGAPGAWADGDEQSADTRWAVTPADGSGRDERSSIQHALDPGESITEHIAVHNLGDREETF